MGHRKKADAAKAPAAVAATPEVGGGPTESAPTEAHPAAGDAPLSLGQVQAAAEGKGEDCPGQYVITHDNIKVSPQLALGADQAGSGGIKRLSVGTVINV